MTRPTWLRPPAGPSAAAAIGVAVALCASLAVPAGAATRPAAPSSLAWHNRTPAQYLTWAESSTGVGYVVQQATNSAFSTGVTSYRLRGPGRAFTPYRVSKGHTYWFRVRAVRSGVYSYWSNRVSFTATWHTSTIRVLSYNTLSASMDNQMDPGGKIVPFWKHTPQREPGEVSLMLGSKADVIGVEEGAHCLVTYTDGTNCYRQVDALAAGLNGTYSLANTMSSPRGVQTRYAGNYIFFKNTVTPLGGGTWYTGISGTTSANITAAYQLFKVNSTGAKFLFVDTHLVTGTTLQGDKYRAAETKNMVSNAASYAANHGVYSIVFGGDFNSYVGEPNVDDLSGNYMRSSHIPDGIEVAQYRYKAGYDSCNLYYRTVRHGHGSIDHLYATGGTAIVSWGELLNVSSGQFVGTIPSDHNPIWAAVAIPY